MTPRIAVVSLCACCALAALPVKAAPEEGALLVVPSEIRAGTFYNGARVTVACEVTEDTRFAVVLEGHRNAVELKEKRKVFGLLWMNVGEIRFENLPTVYKVATGGPDGGESSAEAMHRLGVGYDALERDAGITDEIDRTYFREYLKLKEREGLYEVMPGKILVSEGGDTGPLGEVVFDIPAKAPAGSYDIRLFAMSENGGEQLAEAVVDVRQVGAAAFISRLAENHGLSYGILAAVFAVLIGLLTGVVFGLGGKGGH